MLAQILILISIVNGREILPDSNGEYHIDVKLNKNEFNFLWLGDWGGWPAPVYNTPIQLLVAKSMERTAKQWQPEFIYGIGDNFYFWGVTDIYDVMWTKTYENVYRSDELQVPWYLTTGNHDWDDGNGTAQLAYSSISERWTYPAFHYTIDYELADGTSVRIITIDTPLLTGISTGKNDDPNGSPADQNYANWAWDWIARTMASSGEYDYLFVTGHYQTMDIRGHYNAALVGKLLPLMKEHGVSAYIQGHRHTMEHLQEKGFTNNADVHFFTIGCGSLVNWSAGGLPECNEVCLLLFTTNTQVTLILRTKLLVTTSGGVTITTAHTHTLLFQKMPQNSL